VNVVKFGFPFTATLSSSMKTTLYWFCHVGAVIAEQNAAVASVDEFCVALSEMEILA